MRGRYPAVGRGLRHGLYIARRKFLCPACKFERNPVGILEIERPNVDTGMHRGRNLQLALIVVEHRADPDALVLEPLPISVELLGWDVEREVVHGADRA